MKARDLLFFISVISVFLGLTINVHADSNAYQISPNPNYGTIKINSGAIAENNELFSNSGTLTIYGKLTNYRRLTNDRGGTLTNNGILINSTYGANGLFNNGTLTNNGSLISTGLLISTGTLINNTTLTNNSHLLNYDNLTNYGTMTNSFSAMLNTYECLTNNGTLTNNGYLENNSLGNLYGGKLNNNGIINGSGIYRQYSGQTINNGSITQRVFGIFGGTLSGTGTITGNVSLGPGATIHPGNSPGILTINGTFSSSGTLLIDIAGLEEGKFSLLKINGDAIFTSGNIKFDFIDGFIPKAGDHWDFLFADTITDWKLLSFSLEGLDGSKWDVGFLHEIGNEILRLQITGPPDHAAVPLPSAVILLGAGLGRLGLYYRRKRTAIS